MPAVSNLRRETWRRSNASYQYAFTIRRPKACEQMRALEIIIALIVAALAFVALKLIGLVIHIALIGAVVGLVVGFFIARASRRGE